MCGIYGAIGKYNIDKIKILTLLSEQRGGHSTGYATKHGTVKKAITASDFVLDYDIPESNWIMGHTRYATCGAINDKNSQPFQYKSILSTHNGIIHNFTSKKKYYKDTMEVDSEILGHIIYHEGYANLPMASGYWGLAWYDVREKDTFYLSCHDGELAYCYIDDVLYYASDFSYLQAIGAKYEDIVILENDSVYVFVNGKLKSIVELEFKREVLEDVDYYADWYQFKQEENLISDYWSGREESWY